LQRLLFVILLIGVIVPICLPGSSQADLSEYIRKYRSTAVSAEALERLNHYNHLIDYFTSFSYFRPRYRVSADFIRALILAESGANPYAVSSKNAIGLGQIILTTGQMAARDLYGSSTHFRYVSKERLKDLSRDDLFDPATNILLTCYLIAKYNHMFDGRLDLVISAWNAGENTSSLAIGQHAPYLETKDLIGKVNGYYIYLLKQKGALRK